MSEEVKKILAKVIAYYYENHVYPLAETDNNQANEEDTSLRGVLNELGLRKYLPVDVLRRF